MTEIIDALFLVSEAEATSAIFKHTMKAGISDGRANVLKKRQS